MSGRRISIVLLASSLAAICVGDEPAAPAAAKAAESRQTLNKFVQANCFECHDKATKSGGLALDEIIDADISRHAEAWEKVVHKLTVRQMPPKDAPRPKEGDYDAAIAVLESSLDRTAAIH